MNCQMFFAFRLLIRSIVTTIVLKHFLYSGLYEITTDHCYNIIL